MFLCGHGDFYPESRLWASVETEQLQLPRQDVESAGRRSEGNLDEVHACERVNTGTGCWLWCLLVVVPGGAGGAGGGEEPASLCLFSS